MAAMPPRPPRLVLLDLVFGRRLGMWDIMVAVPAAHFLLVGRPVLAIAIAAIWFAGSIAGEHALLRAAAVYASRAFGRPLPLDPRKPR